MPMHIISSRILVVSPIRALVAYVYVDEIPEQHELALEMKYDPLRQYYIRIAMAELEEKERLPEVFINAYRKKTFLECQTLDLLK